MFKPENLQMDKEIKDFSKEQSRPERDNLAGEIYEKRKTYFERKKALSLSISELKTEAGVEENKAWQLRKEIELIENEINEIRQSKISELLNFFKLKQLNKNLNVKSVNLENFEKTYAEMRDEIESLEETIADKKEIRESKKIIDDFYKDQSQKWNEYKEDLREVDVSNVIKKYDVAFIHAIRPDFTPSSNSPLVQNIDWQTKLDITLSLDPSVSASTIKEGETSEKMWGRMGVVLKGGKISSANTGDAGTISSGLNERASNTNLKDLKSDIEKSISIPDRVSYNEMVVNDPQIAGFFICRDERSQFRINSDVVPDEEIAKNILPRHIPVFIIKSGIIYSSEFDEAQNKFIEKEIVTKKELLNNDFNISDLDKKEMQEKLFENSPFKIRNPEIQGLEDSAKGRYDYIHLKFLGKNSEELGQNRTISEHPKIGSKVTYKIENGKLVEDELNARTKSIKRNYLSLDKWGLQEINLRVMGSITYDTEAEIKDIDSYILEAEKTIKNLSEKLIEEIQDKNQKFINHTTERLNNLYFRLCGFAEQAGEMGDIEIKNKIFSILGENLSEEKFKEIVNRRLDANGHLKITEEDLKSLN